MRLGLVLLLLAACRQTTSSDATPAPSASGAAVASAVPAAPPAVRPWFEGSWQGRFQAELLRIELAAGGLKEWKQDDGVRASGPGTLKLVIGADGSVNGNASGALGELVVTGRAEGDRAGLTLHAAEPDGFHGVALASQTPDGMQGTLNASSADSLRVRQAKLSLAREAP